MHVGGIDNHGTSHRVTNCMHDHRAGLKGGGMRSAASAPEQVTQVMETQAETPSLFQILRNLMSSGKGLLGRIWGESGQTENDSAYITAKESHHPGVAAAASGVQPSQSRIQNNPYFTTTSDTGVIRVSPFKKIRIRLQKLTGQMGRRLGGRMSGHFSGKSTLESGRRNPQEDLRKRSRYKEDDLEIDCVLTDDSYLMDSYDRRGAYSKLTTESGGKSPQNENMMNATGVISND